MQTESPKNFPFIEFFLPDDNEYDSEETLDFLGYDLVEMLDEINVEKNEVIIDDNEMEKVDDVISEEEYDNDAIIYDDVNNLQKRKRKRRKKIFLQTEIDELQNKLHANKYQQSIKVFFKPKKIRYEEENTIVQKVACKGLYEEKYREYVLNSPAEFGGSVQQTRRATGKNIRFIPKCYLEHPLSKLLLNTNLKSLWVSADEDNDNTAIWTKLAQFGKDGFFKGEKTFQELVSLMIQIQEKKLRNKKTTGLRYSEHLKQFFSLLSESSREYEIFRQMFAGMSLIKELNWNGPVVGMTDCTKIRPKLTYSDELGGIVGSTLKLSETSVQTYDDIHNVINYIKQKKAIATQVKVIVLKIPIEKIPPLVISMLPTNGGSNTAEIYDLLMNVITMSRDAGVNLVSLGSDGAPVEYNAQQLIMNSEKAETFFEFYDNYYNVHFQMPIYRNLPIITVQDPKHAKKTARNQLHSGARLLVLGNNVILYRHLLTLAQSPDHALYMWDVVNVDKQDDGAAYRVFHSDILAQIYQTGLENNEMQSLFAYLFVLGTNYNGYAWIFFLNMWIEYIEDSSKLYNSMFSIAKNFISPQSFKIFTNLAKSLILLIISHREFYSSYPLYPWEHGTEAIEHVFGISRQITNDFSFYEFFKIQQCVAYRDKIIRQNMQIQKEKTSASAYEDAAKFIKVLGIKLLNDNGFDFNNDESDLNEDYSLTNAALEVSQLSQLADLEQQTNEPEQEHKLSDLSKIELDYILNTSKKYFPVIELEQNELFYIDGSMNISQIIQIRASHNAFSRSERPCQNRQLNAIRSSNNQAKLKQNSANLLVSEFFRNDSTFELINRSRKERWMGRKKLENIGLPQHVKASNISYANVTDNNPLQENNFILYISKEEILLGKVLSIYKLVSKRHAYISFSKDIDSLSYISVATYINIDGNLFSPASKTGGNLFAHITPKQVIYHFDNSSDVIYTNSTVVNLIGRLCLIGNSWEIFDFFHKNI
ncbi:unnamed protein product [Rhizophagus irregularis]|nr:unnamed protein product [Rhizophagus irregularis]